MNTTVTNTVVRAVADALTPTKTAPFVPTAEIVPPAVDKFVGVIDKQFRATYELLLNSAEVLEGKAKELRKRADNIMKDRMAMEASVRDSVRYEDECRHVALSLSMIPVENTQ